MKLENLNFKLTGSVFLVTRIHDDPNNLRLFGGNNKVSAKAL